MSFGKIQGIDFSHHNDIYDIDLLARSCDFVYLKCSQGGDWADPKFKERYAALKGKTYRGVYHFLDYYLGHYTKGKELEFGALQADYAYNLVKDDFPELDIWLDIETNDIMVKTWGAITTGAFGNIGRVLKIAMGFKNRWKELTGKIIGIYTRNEFGKFMYNFDDGILAIAWYPYAFVNITKRISNFGTLNPDRYVYPWTSWTFWQNSMTCDGATFGIRGKVDLDVFNGTEEDWSIYVGNNLPTSDPVETEDPEPICEFIGKKAIALQMVNIRQYIGTSSAYVMVAPKDAILEILETGVDTLGNQWIRCGYKEWACVNFNGTPLLKIL
jgi:lysozyme